MSQHLFHEPTLSGVLWGVIPIAFVLIIRAAGSLLVGVWIPHVRGFWPWVCFQILNAVARDDVMLLPNLLFWAWVLFGQNIPWNKWGKKLKAKASSLTEVATAALKRQQTEAFQ